MDSGDRINIIIKYLYIISGTCSLLAGYVYVLHNIYIHIYTFHIYQPFERDG